MGIPALRHGTHAFCILENMSMQARFGSRHSDIVLNEIYVLSKAPNIMRRTKRYTRTEYITMTVSVRVLLVAKLWYSPALNSDRWQALRCRALYPSTFFEQRLALFSALVLAGRVHRKRNRQADGHEKNRDSGHILPSIVPITPSADVHSCRDGVQYDPEAEPNEEGRIGPRSSATHFGVAEQPKTNDSGD